MNLRESILLDGADPSRKAVVSADGKLSVSDASATAGAASLVDLLSRVGTVASPAANTLLELLTQGITRLGNVSALPTANTILGRLKDATDALGDTTGGTAGTVTERLASLQDRVGDFTTYLPANQQLYIIRQLLGMVPWTVAGTAGGNVTLTLTKAAVANQIHVLTWVDVSYSGSGNGNNASVAFNGTTLLRPKANGDGIVNCYYDRGVATPGANQAIVLTLPAIGGAKPQSSKGAMGGYTLYV